MKTCTTFVTRVAINSAFQIPPRLLVANLIDLLGDISYLAFLMNINRQM